MAKRGINKVILVGNLGKDPEVRYLDQGIAVANFSLATTESFRNKEGVSTERTEWHNIVLWRGLAETAGKYLKKGSTVYLEGRIVNRSWDDAEGVKKYRTEIEANNMVMLDSRGSGSDIPATPPVSAYSNAGGAVSQAQAQPQVQSPKPQAQPAAKPEVSAEDAADDLPF